MNKTGTLLSILVLGAVITGSYFATQTTLERGNVFQIDLGGGENTASLNFRSDQEEFDRIRMAAESEKTPADYAITGMRLYLPAVAGQEDETVFDENIDQDKAINKAEISQKTNSGIADTYMARVLIKNLGTSPETLPKVQVSLNGEIISDSSNILRFTRVQPNSMEAIIEIPSSFANLKESDNLLQIKLDPEGKINDAELRNNLIEMQF